MNDTAFDLDHSDWELRQNLTFPPHVTLTVRIKRAWRAWWRFWHWGVD